MSDGICRGGDHSRYPDNSNQRTAGLEVSTAQTLYLHPVASALLAGVEGWEQEDSLAREGGTLESIRFVA